MRVRIRPTGGSRPHESTYRPGTSGGTREGVQQDDLEITISISTDTEASEILDAQVIEAVVAAITELGVANLSIESAVAVTAEQTVYKFGTTDTNHIIEVTVESSINNEGGSRSLVTVIRLDPADVTLGVSPDVNQWESTESCPGSIEFSFTVTDDKPHVLADQWGDWDGIEFNGDDRLGETFPLNNCGPQSSIGYVAALVRIDALLSASGEEVILGLAHLGSDKYLKIGVQYWDGANPVMYIEHDSGSSVDRVLGSTTLTATTYVMEWWSDGTNYHMALDGVEETLSVDAGTDSGDWVAEVDSDFLNVGAAHIGSILLQGGTEAHLNGTAGFLLMTDGYVPNDAERTMLREWLDWIEAGNYTE